VAMASVDAAGVTYTVRALADCGVVVAGTSTEPIAGGCRPRSVELIEVVAVGTARGLPELPPPPPPGAGGAPAVAAPDGTMVVLARVGGTATQVQAVLVAGGTVAGAVGDDGWAVVVTDGRAFLLEARDARGTIVARARVT
ncbi:MAG TPA: hypothetical protein VF244_02605, partial [Acidimicrobiales bacterium]